jgi:membrane protease YdiL (CAAX protease family)
MENLISVLTCLAIIGLNILVSFLFIKRKNRPAPDELDWLLPGISIGLIFVIFAILAVSIISDSSETESLNQAVKIIYDWPIGKGTIIWHSIGLVVILILQRSK